jgi:electron transport complex protein RnfB
MPEDRKKTRREFLADGVRAGAALAAGGVLVSLARGAKAEQTVWQIDPMKCVQCGNCATNCVLTPSAAKCMRAYALCGYCKLCFGLFRDKRSGDTVTAENNRCPVDAIKRNPVEDPYYEMSIDESLCIGCAKCVKGCNLFGNGSMFMQIRHDRCVNCNQCAIAASCPSQAVHRVPASKPYIIKQVKSE